MFDAEYFSKHILDQIDELGGGASTSVTVHLNTGAEYRVQKIGPAHPGYVLLSVYPPEGQSKKHREKRKKLPGDDSELQFTYTRLPGQVDVDAGTPGPGHFLIDPFGNVVGTAPVVNPNSALFGKTIVGGDSIQTQASVTVNAYDLELVKPIVLPWSQWLIEGVRELN